MMIIYFQPNSQLFLLCALWCPCSASLATLVWRHMNSPVFCVFYRQNVVVRFEADNTLSLIGCNQPKHNTFCTFVHQSTGCPEKLQF